MSIKLEQCDPKLRARVLRQVRQEDERKGLYEAVRSGRLTFPPDYKPQMPTLRQERRRPLLNKLEQRVKARVELEHPGTVVHAQAMRFRLANGAWYKPDLAAWLSLARTTGGHGFKLHCWEAKCLAGKGAKKGVLAVKVAAAQFPEVAFWLVTQHQSGLRFERVEP